MFLFFFVLNIFHFRSHTRENWPQSYCFFLTYAILCSFFGYFSRLITSSPHRLIASSPHRLIASSPLRLIASSPLTFSLITSSPHRLITSSPHRLIASSPHRLIASSPLRLIASSPHRLIASSPHRLIAPSSPAYSHPHVHKADQRTPDILPGLRPVRWSPARCTPS